MQEKFIYQCKLKLIITILVDMDNGATSLPLFLYSCKENWYMQVICLCIICKNDEFVSKNGQEGWFPSISCLAMVVGDGEGEG